MSTFRCFFVSLSYNSRSSCIHYCSGKKLRPTCQVPSSACALLIRQHATASTPGLKAADIARRIRQKKEQNTDASDKVQQTPMQKRVTELKQFSQQLQSVHPNVLAKALSKSILFQNENIVAINKPYGVPVYDSPGTRNSIMGSIPILARMIGNMKAGSQLHLCHALEKETTGVMFLARSEEAAEQIQQLLRTLQVERKYWAIVVGVPVPSEGLIDIPIIEREVVGPRPHFKMALSPVFRVNDEGDGVTRIRSSRQAHSAVTQYRVLDSSHACSLVELQPATAGVKHQLRVHMALALACPILGDHKYSHCTKLAPQRLPEGVLHSLGLEQSKTRYLPLHLHARQMTLPGFKGRGEITVSCPLPKYFTSSLHRLQISLPEKS